MGKVARKQAGKDQRSREEYAIIRHAAAEIPAHQLPGLQATVNRGKATAKFRRAESNPLQRYLDGGKITEPQKTAGDRLAQDWAIYIGWRSCDITDTRGSGSPDGRMIAMQSYQRAIDAVRHSLPQLIVHRVACEAVPISAMRGKKDGRNMRLLIDALEDLCRHYGYAT